MWNIARLWSEMLSKCMYIHEVYTDWFAIFLTKSFFFIVFHWYVKQGRFWQGFIVIQKAKKWNTQITLLKIQKYYAWTNNMLSTRMHSSRMCTARPLTVSHSIWWGGVCPNPPGCRPLSWMQTPQMQTPPLWTDQHLWKHNLHKLRLWAVMNKIKFRTLWKPPTFVPGNFLLITLAQILRASYLCQ